MCNYRRILYCFIIPHHFTTLQMISLSANQPFYGIHQPCRFYSCFDVFDETDVKYLFLNFLADEKTEVLYAFTAVCGKIFFLIRQQFHCAVADIDQVDQHLDPFAAPYHVAAKRPECFLLIIFHRKEYRNNGIYCIQLLPAWFKGSFSCHAQKICSSSGNTVLKKRRFAVFSFPAEVT